MPGGEARVVMLMLILETMIEHLKHIKVTHVLEQNPSRIFILIDQSDIHLIPFSHRHR